jgi:FkbM family methyltransferase
MSKRKKMLMELFKRASSRFSSTNSLHDLIGNRRIILYGAGDGFITFSVFVLRKYGLEPYAILDRKFKAGHNHFGIPAFSPHEYKPTTEEKENAVVVITVGKKEHYEEIFRCLKDLGFRNVLLATDIYEYHLLYEPEELKAKGPNYYLENKDKIIECLGLFTDNMSREVYIRFLQTHMIRKPIPIPACELAEQYFPKDIRLTKGYSRFVNCGAYNGDTIKRLNKIMGKVEAIICFEPDPENFQMLTQYLLSRKNEIAELVISFPCGVFSHETQLRFSIGNRINSAISHSGDSVIQCVALDHVIPRFNPTFISMDVEGSELEALKGAEMLIKENKPDLAISVYHSPSHIWEIPLHIKSLYSGYRFYLRNYTSFPSETILYAAA